MKNFRYLLVFFFLLSCGYTPIYQTDQNSEIKLDIINYSGDKKLGRTIVKGIERLKNNKSRNIYDLNFTCSKKESVAALLSQLVPFNVAIKAIIGRDSTLLLTASLKSLLRLLMQ